MSGTVNFVLERWMMFGAVVGKIGVAGGAIEAELALGFETVEPPESHVH